jgi:DNA-binding GntR family transcriptional regulator
LGVHSTIDWALEQGVPVGPQVYRTLRKRIIRAELAPGARVSETALAKAFSLSRQPVREAFIKLADDGLVEVRPQRGTLVCKISIASVMDARFVREAVEADIVKLVAEQHDAALVKELRKMIEAQRKTIGLHADEFMRLDEQFHRALAVAAGKSQVFRVVDNVKAQMDRVRFLTLMNRSVIEISIDQHAKVVDGIERGAPAEADAAMRTHLRQILIDLPHVAALKPEFFDDTSENRSNKP